MEDKSVETPLTEDEAFEARTCNVIPTWLVQDEAFQARRRNALLQVIGRQDMDYLGSLNPRELENFLLERVTKELEDVSNDRLVFIIEEFDGQGLNIDNEANYLADFYKEEVKNATA